MKCFTSSILLSLIGYALVHPIDFSPDEVLFRSVDTTDAGVEYRLPTNISPVKYTIELTPYFVDETPYKAFEFKGHVSLQIMALESGVKEIVLHARDLEIQTIKVLNSSEELTLIYNYTNDTEMLTITLNEELATTIIYTIEIDYKGFMDDSMSGFYRSYYVENGVKRWLGTTQFQSTSARKAFPCMDEPKFKSAFQLIMNRPSSYSETITNTKLENQTTVGNRVREVFKQTPIMSSYLVAFIVSEFENKTDGLHSVYSRPEGATNLDYSLEFTKSITAKMNEWVDYPFNSVDGIEKNDMIAIPDFSAGAMENWGAMTYRETNMLWDKDHSTELNKQRIAAVLTHETAHLWFGDLVTCDWWGVTWLNEGFARYFQYFGTAMVETGMELEWQFVVEQLQGVFQLDSTNSTFPMTNNEVYTPSQASAMFGSISYNKGASILRWIEHHIKTTNFKDAIRSYLKKNMLKTVVPDKLFLEFEAVAPQLNVSTIFKPWTEQVGYPLITATREGNDLKLTQKRFIQNDNDHNDQTLWTIPLTLATRKEDFENTTTQVLFPPSSNFEISLPEDEFEYYILNIQQVGFYRVNYDTQNWIKIREALFSENYGGIHVANRAQIVDDLFNLARNNIWSYDFIMAIIDYIQNEKEYHPWLSALNGFSYLARRSGTEENSKIFSEYILLLIENIYGDLGFIPKTNEKHTDTLNRNQIIMWACRYGHEGCINSALEEFEKFRTTLDYKVNPNIRLPVYCVGMRNGNLTDFDYLWNIYNTTNVDHEKLNVLNALGCSKDKNLIYKYLDFVLTDGVRDQDRSSAFNYAYLNSDGNVDIVYEYTKENFEKIGEKLGVSGIFTSLADRFTNSEQVNDLEQFAESEKDKLGESTYNSIKRSATSARLNLEWDEARLKEVRDYVFSLRGGAPVMNLSLAILIMAAILQFVL